MRTKPIIFLARLLAVLVMAQPAAALPPAMVGYDPSKQIRFATPVQAEARRRELIEFIWPGGLPSRVLPTVTGNIAAEEFDRNLPGIDRGLVAAADKLDTDIAPYDFHSISYLIHPLKHNANTRRLVIYHSGHRKERTEWAGGDDVINRVLAAGFTTLVMDMPFYGWNADNTISLPDGEVTIAPKKHEGPHQEMFDQLLPKLPNQGAIFRFFLEPVVQGINCFLQTNPGADVTMVGISGGGWATHMAAALDPRIKLSFPVAGSYPLYCRTKPFPAFSHDIEQYYDPLYQETDANGDGITDTAAGVASWLEIYALGGCGPGRRQVQILNLKDSCCFFGDAFMTYADFVTGVVRKLDQGEWRFHSDVTHARHWISADVIDTVVMPGLAGSGVPDEPTVRNGGPDAIAPPVADEQQRQAGVPDAIAPVKAPFPMPDLQRPVFPDRSFSIADFGALADGTFKNTGAFRKAIDACNAAGGGRVVVPPGQWLTGPIHLKSNVNLHLAEGAEIHFSDDPQDYLPPVMVRYAGIECYNYSPLIYAIDCFNIAITGRGSVHGHGQKWWQWSTKGTGTGTEVETFKRQQKMVDAEVPVAARIMPVGDQHGFRPQFIQPIRCTNVLLEGITIAAPGPFWTVQFLYCENVIARGLIIHTRGGPNTDGINVDSTRNVLIEDNLIDAGDDCICLKSGRDEDGRRVARPTENVVVRNCKTLSGHGGVVIGSEMSGDVRNVWAHDCDFTGTNIGIRIKTMRGRGGVVENLFFQDITMNKVDYGLHMTAFYHATPAEPVSERTPTLRGVHLKNIIAHDVKRNVISVTGLPERPVAGLLLENLTIDGAAGAQFTDVADVKLADVRLTPAKGPVFALRDAADVLIERSPGPKGASLFLDVQGGRTKNVRLMDCDYSGARQGIVCGRDVPADAKAQLVTP